MTAAPHPPVLCLGEALIDVITSGQSSSERVGGSPLNVAVGLAALGHPTMLASCWGADQHGRQIEAYLAERGVGIVGGSSAASRTATARARLDAQGHASYEFDLEWRPPALPASGSFGHLHTGSLAATLEPGGAAVLAAVQRSAGHHTISYDPNVRPALMGSPDAVRERIERLITLADVVKASDEDIAWLYGADATGPQVLHRWLASGPALVVATRGTAGAIAMLAGEDEPLELAALPVEVADTVGAGDSFMAGLLSGLLDAGLLGSAASRARLRSAGWAQLRGPLQRAVATAGLTVARVGAHGPGRDELAVVLDFAPDHGPGVDAGNS